MNKNTSMTFLKIPNFIYFSVVILHDKMDCLLQSDNDN